MNNKHLQARSPTERSMASTSHSTHSQKGELDMQYLQLREVICNTEFYRTTTRHNRIRLNLWSRKLDQIVSDLPWKRNRNNYIKLMYLMAQSEVIVEPLLSLPPEGELPFLRNYQINAVVDLVESKVNQKIAKFGYCRQCLNEERQRNLPFRLSTARTNLNLEEDQISVERLTLCNHACLHPSKKEAPKDQMLKYQSKTTIEPISCSESNLYILCDQNEKENENNNITAQKPMKGSNRDTQRYALKQITNKKQNSQQLHKFHQQSWNNFLQETQEDLSQHITIPTVKVFHHTGMNKAIE